MRLMVQPADKDIRTFTLGTAHWRGSASALSSPIGTWACAKGGVANATHIERLHARGHDPTPFHL